MISTNLGPTATKALVALALTVGSTVTAAPAMAACQAGQGSCVLPIADVPPAPPMTEAPPPAGEVGAAVSEAAAGGGGISAILVLGALALLGLGAYFLFFDDDEPVTP
jgi:hypothetical protein